MVYPECFKELIPLQQKHCGILSWLSDFCAQYHIEWCLAFGSALGARRHGGPIPWDDDADIYMTARDYARFRELFHKYGDKERFYLQELDSVDGMCCMPKLRMNGTAFIEESLRDMDMHHGIYIDIFLLHEAPRTNVGKLLGVFSTSYITLKRLSNHHYTKRKAVVPLMAFLRLFPRRFGLRTAYRQLYKWDSREGAQLADWELYTGHPRWFLDRDVIFPVRKTRYAGHEFWIPNQIERYLEICYGNWQEIPDLTRIKWTRHAKNWSTTRDFHEILPHVTDYHDEII